LRLYNFVLDGQATNEVKRISVFENIPCIMPNLNSALCTDSSNVVYYDAEEEDYKTTPVKSQSDREANQSRNTMDEDPNGE